MCGIYCCITRRQQTRDPDRHLTGLLKQRGPDYAQLQNSIVQTNSGEYAIQFFATVLALRGDALVEQPCIDRCTNNVLCWNGEAWAIDSGAVPENDTLAIFKLLSTISTEPGIQLHLMDSVTGPFAFVFYDAPQSRLYFGRDPFGRRSLLLRAGVDELAISSVGDGREGWVEIDADGIYMIDFGSCTTDLLVAYARPLPQFRCFPLYCFPYSNGLDTRRLEASITDHQSINSARVVAELEEQLRRAVVLRLPIAKSFHYTSKPGEAANLAILFSGGLDCTILARLVSDHLPPEEPVDLLNVAFENPRIHQSIDDPYEQCPDRKTARSSLQELRRVCPDRTWRLVQINVPYNETIKHRDIICSLMYPHRTEMDLSISYALFFASRGSGMLQSAQDNCYSIYTTPAKILFSGLGADELFGGYQRHATAFARNGHQGLLVELETDLGRLGRRNLGRDDRVLSHSGRETRYPYLDEDVINWTVKTPVAAKTGFYVRNTEEGNGNSELGQGKLVLRQLASKLGLVQAAKEKKRAIQFGARTAKMEKGKVKGDHLISETACTSV